MKVVQLPEKKLVGLRVVCPGEEYSNEIPKAALVLADRISEIKQKVSSNLIGAFVAGDFSDELDGYWVCVEVEEFTEIPDGMVTLTVPTQRYAVVTHKGPNNKIRNTYKLLHDWITENSYERDLSAWHLEIMQVWGNINSQDITVELYDTIKN